MAILRRKRTKTNLTRLSSQSSVRDLIKYAEQEGLLKYPLPVEALAKKIGLTVAHEPLTDNISGHLRSESGRWIITVNAYHHPNRQRFTIAHELGHFFLHRDQSDAFTDRIMFRENGKQSPMEWQANDFAAELLMPKDEFSNLLKREIRTVDAIAKHFGVSALAVRYRAKNLGFIGHGL